MNGSSLPPSLTTLFRLQALARRTLSPAASTVFCAALQMTIERQDTQIPLSTSALAQATGQGLNTVRRALAEGLEAGFLLRRCRCARCHGWTTSLHYSGHLLRCPHCQHKCSREYCYTPNLLVETAPDPAEPPETVSLSQRIILAQDAMEALFCGLTTPSAKLAHPSPASPTPSAKMADGSAKMDKAPQSLLPPPVPDRATPSPILAEGGCANLADGSPDLEDPNPAKFAPLARSKAGFEKEIPPVPERETGGMPDLETPAHRYRSSDDDISKENIIITDRSIDLAIEKVNVLSTGEPREGQAALRPTPAPLPLQPPEVQPTWCLVIPEQGDVLSLEDRQRLNAWDNENRQLARYSVKAVGDSAKSYAFHLKAWRGARLTDIIRQDPNVQAYHGLMAVVNQTRQDAADPEKRVQSVGAWFNGQVKAYFAAQGIDWNVVERLAGGSKAARRLSEPDPVPPLPDPILAVFRQQYLAEGSPPA